MKFRENKLFIFSVILIVTFFGAILKYTKRLDELNNKVVTDKVANGFTLPKLRQLPTLFQPLSLTNGRRSTDNNEINSRTVLSSKISGEDQSIKKEDLNIFSEKQNGIEKTQLRQGRQKDQVATRFNKIDFYGQRLTESALRWSCARDVKTGLLWETKLFDAGVSDVEHRFSWYDPTKLSPGLKGKGHCFGIDCDTDAYAQEINSLGLCGSTRWRLPSFAELQTLLDRDYSNPVINQEIFFNTKGASYWTSSQLAYDPEMVMQIRFFDGTSSPAPVHMNLAVRLVSQ